VGGSEGEMSGGKGGMATVHMYRLLERLLLISRVGRRGSWLLTWVCVCRRGSWLLTWVCVCTTPGKNP
jgi:hypothetical protein